ncbi:hypothetical protein UCREL1_2008 [Eutypa lata UCREL1]|uniref:Uncharacterized protein n=1 Tax=Eutypa lata (strain UCR-EL1) TaxID=1287681 RepID=M7TWC0_EUTLA|nr:hypothetical protein UCREL1_2008 [Eutypa lata UCREL1]
MRPPTFSTTIEDKPQTILTTHSTNMFPTFLRRLADKPLISSTIRNTQVSAAAGLPNTRFKLKKVWPPDFSKLSEKEQFRFERRYKRRIKLATARPRWDKIVKLAQLSSITCECSIECQV